MTLVTAFTDDALGFLDGELSAAAAYLVVFLFVAGDAVIPILPGETTLNAASVRASDGYLDLWLVMVAGSLGAIVGDSALYWIARLSRTKVQAQLEKLQQDTRVQRAMQLLGQRYAILIVFGRYVPGLRFFINASMGILPLPYRQFLLWSSLGGITWAVYTCLLAYAVGSALEDYPIASMITSGIITTALIGAMYWLDVRRRRSDGSDGLAATEITPS